MHYHKERWSCDKHSNTDIGQRRSGPCRLWGPNRLVCQSATLQRRNVRDWKGPSTILSSSRWSLGHTDDAGGVYFFSPTRWSCLRLWLSLDCRQNHCRRPGKRFLFMHILEKILHQICIEVQRSALSLVNKSVESYQVPNWKKETYSELLSNFGAISFQWYASKGITRSSTMIYSTN